MDSPLKVILRNTNRYLESLPKEERLDLAQFITPSAIALFISKWFNHDYDTCHILEPGAGTGILSSALVLYLVENRKVKSVSMDLYEIDSRVMPFLEINMAEVKRFCQEQNVVFSFRIINDNFILNNQISWEGINKEKEYDIVITNPPYKKLGKNSPEAICMSSIIFGQPNIYVLFIALSIKMLKKNGEFACIVPRSFFNGSYFRLFRAWLHSNAYIARIHHFDSRTKVFNSEVLQEIVLLYITKAPCSLVTITSSVDTHDISSSRELYVHNGDIISKRDASIRLPVSNEDTGVLKLFDEWDNSLENMGFRFSTGPIVDFRNKEVIRDAAETGTVPLLWSWNFSDLQINWPKESGKYKQYIIRNEKTARILLEKGTYILVKRFASKEAKRPLRVNILTSSTLNQYMYFGIENHVNYLRIDNSVDSHIFCGICALLNSTLYNRYFKITNGTTQINVSDLNKLPFPKIETIMVIGKGIGRLECTKVADLDEYINSILITSTVCKG